MILSHNSNRTGGTSGTGTAAHTEAPGFIPGFSGVRVVRSLVVCVVFFRPLSVHFRFMASTNFSCHV
jgi:hypothetical protein